MYEFKLINQELAESRLYRTTGSFSRLSGRDIADLFYLQTLSTYMFVLDNKQHDYGIAYATKTCQYGPYAVFRTAATDLYLLGFVINNPDYGNLKISGSDRSLLKSLSFQNRKHFMFMQRLAKDAVSKSDATTFLFRLETQLKIENPIFKQMRRLIVEWQSFKIFSKTDDYK